MESKQLLITALRQSQGLVWPLFEDLRSAPHVPSTVGGNHAHWIAGHLLVSEGHMLHAIMRGEANPVERFAPLFAGRTRPDPAAQGYPAYDEVLEQLGAMRAKTLELLESLDEAALDQPSRGVPPGFEAFFGVWRQCFLMQALHWMNHRGQLADCRRSAGREPLMA